MPYHFDFSKIWPSKVSHQIILGVIVVNFLILTVFLFDFVERQQHLLEEQHKEEVATTAEVIGAYTKHALMSGDSVDMHRVLELVDKLTRVQYIIIFSDKGKIVRSYGPTISKLNRNDSIDHKLSGLKKLEFLRTSPEMQEVGMPVLNDRNSTIGYLRIGVDHTYISKIKSEITRKAVIYMIVALLVLIVIISLIARKLIKELYKLIFAADAIAAGKSGVEVEGITNEELAKLGLVLNKMADSFSLNEGLIEKLLETIPVGVWVLNNEGQVVSINKASKKIWCDSDFAADGFKRTIGKNVLTGKHFEEADWPAMRVLHNGENFISEEVEIICFTNKVKRILNSAVPLKNKQNQLAGVLNIEVDVTEIKKVQDRLLVINNELNERVKELTCLFQVFEIINDRHNSIEDVFSKLVSILPEGYQYPDRMCVRLTYSGKVFLSDVFQETAHKQEINECAGCKLEVFSMSEPMIDGADVFLKEERDFLDTIGEVIKGFIERRIAEDKLRISESILSAAFDNSPLGVALVGHDQRWIRINKALSEMMGYDEDELITYDFLKITHPDDIEASISFFTRTMNGANPVLNIEKRYVRKDGTIIWANVNAAPVKDMDGNVLFMAVHVEDITEKRSLTESLIASNNYMKLFIANSPAAIAMVNKNMEYIAVSNRWISDYKLEGQEIIGKSHYEIFPELPERWKADHAYCMEGHTLKSDEDSFERLDGKIQWLRWELHPWYESNGELGGLIMLTESITERKEVELNFKNLVEQSIVGVYILQNGKFAYMNPKCAEIFGYKETEMIGQPLSLVQHPEDAVLVNRQVAERIEGIKESAHYESRAIKRNGEEIWVEVFGNKTVYKGANAIIGTLVDITERKKAESAIREKVLQLEAITNNLPGVITYQLIRELNGYMHVAYISSGIQKLIGFSQKEFIDSKLSYYDLVHKDDIKKLQQAEQMSLEGLSMFSEEIRFVIMGGVERTMLVKALPRKLPDGRVIWDGILSDITDRIKIEQALLRLNRLYQFKSRINDVVIRSNTKEEVFSKICDIAVRFGKVEMAWIGFYNSEKDELIPFKVAGNENGYLKAIKISGKDVPLGMGPTGRAIRTKTYHYTNDIAHDPLMAPWREEALRRNFRSSISMPIVVNSELVAVLTMYMTQPNFFNESEIKLLKEAVDSIAFKLDKMRLADLHSLAVEELSRSEEMNRSMLNVFPDKIFRITRQGVFTHYHVLNETDLYTQPSVFLGNNLRTFLPAEVADIFMNAIEQAFVENKLMRAEFDLPINGRIRHNEARVIKMNDSEVLFVIRDITSEKDAVIKLEKTLKEVSDYKYAIDEASLVDISDSEGIITSVNKRFLDVIGYDEKDLIGRDHRILNSGYHPSSFFEILWNTVLADKVFKGQVRNKTKSGEYLWCDTTIVPFVDASGKPYQFLTIRNDITQRKKAEEELQESEEKFRSLVEQSLVGVYICQPDKFVYVNPGFEKITGYTKEQLLGEKSIEDILIKEDLKNFRKQGRPGSKNYGQKNHYVVRGKRSDHSLIYMDVLVTDIIYQGKNAVIGTMVDVTDRVKEEETIRKAVNDAQENERLQIGMELHDNVKQILAASNLYLEIANDHLEDKQKAAENIDRSSKYIEEAIFELRRLSHQLAPSIDPATSLQQKIVRLVNNMNVGNRITVSVDVDDADMPFDKDVQLAFYRIVQEQFNNILKYAKASSVLISIKKNHKGIQMLITDDGVGFDFNLTKEGIGLENIKRRAQLFGGKADVITAPGKGCTVSVLIPTQTETLD